MTKLVLHFIQSIMVRAVNHEDQALDVGVVVTLEWSLVKKPDQLYVVIDN